MAHFRKKLDNFPICEVPSHGNKKKERVTGLKALKAQLTLLQKKGGATLHELEMLVVMKARLSEDDQAVVSQLVDAAIEQGGGAIGSAPLASSSSGSGSKSEKAGRQTAKIVASFFA